MDPEKPHAVYWIHAGDVIMYIGMSHDPGFRFSAHRGRRSWMDVTHIELKWYANHALAWAAETAAIKEHRPEWNTIHAGRIPSSKGSNLADWMCGQIRSGEWPVGDYVAGPAEWTTPGYGPKSIRTALDLLLNRGILRLEDGLHMIAADAPARLAAIPDDRGKYVACFHWLDRLTDPPPDLS